MKKMRRIEMKKKLYKLVTWPESQEYMTKEGVVLYNEEPDKYPCAYFVPIEEDE